MKTTSQTKRRTFLRTTAGVAGLAALFPKLGETVSLAAEFRGKRRRKADFDKVIADLDAKSRQLVTIGKKDCQFLHLLVKTAQARSVLELGTGYGFATIWMGLALEETGGKLTTVEILADRAQAARKHVGGAALSERVTFKEGDAHQVLPTLEGPFDFVFLNADKDGLMDYFQKLYPKKLLPGGLLVAYGAILRQEKMKDYLDMISKHPDFDTVGVSATLEDGFAVSYRTRT